MIKNQPMSEYLAHSGVSSSNLKYFLEHTPKDYLYSLNQAKKETTSQAKGTLYHTYILERELYLQQHMIQPEDWGPLSQNPGKKKWDEFKKKAKDAGKTPVKFKDASDLLALEKEMQNHKPLMDILNSHESEVSFYGELDGIQLKSREDLWSNDRGTVWDVKTTSKPIDDERLEKTIYENGYHFSAAHHMTVMALNGMNVNSWGWIFVSTNTPAPHIVIKKASKQVIDAGYTDWNFAFKMLQNCIENKEWPGYSEEIEEIGLPDWAERYY